MFNAGRFIGCFFMLLVAYANPKSTLFTCTSAFFTFSMLIILAKIIPDFSKPLFIISRFATGFLNSYSFINYMLVSKAFEDDRGKLRMWFTLTSLGDILAVPVGQWMVVSLGWDWSIPYLIISALLWLAALGIKLFVEDADHPQDG